MVFEPKKNLLKIRTFAQDLESARAQSGLPVVENKKTNIPAPQPKPVPVTPKAPVMAAAKTPTVPTAPAKTLPVIPSTPTTPPAFHDLQAKIAPLILKGNTSSTLKDSGANQPPQPPRKTVSVRARKPAPVKSSGLGGATIITDSRSSGFKLFPAIIGGISAWIGSFKSHSKENTTPKYTVTESERRRGVIEKATSKSGSIFTADNDALRDEIRRRRETPLPVPDAEPEITWSPNTEVGFPLLSQGVKAPTISNVSINFKQRTTPTTAPLPPIVDTPKVTPVKVPEPVFVEPTNIITPTDIVAPIEDTAPVQPEPNPEPIPRPIVVTKPPNQTETEVPYELTVPEAHYKIRGLGDITKLNTNALSLSIVGVIALLIVFVIAIKIFLGFVIPDEIFTNPPPITPLTSSITTTLDIPLETYTPAALSTALQQVPNDYPVEIRIVDKNGEQLDTDITLSLVGLDRNQNLSGLITDVHLILRNPEQAIVFTVSDATASFGSLLSMEPQLTSTFGGILKTSTVSTCTYKDIALPKSDLRVCNNENGEELLVYGFINSNTVLITRDLTTFTAILGSSQ